MKLVHWERDGSITFPLEVKKQKVSVVLEKGNNEIEDSVYEELEKHILFQGYVKDGVIKFTTPKQSAKDQKHDEKILKELEELRGKLKSQDAKDQEIASLKKQVAHLSANQKAKPGPKPQGN